MPRPGQVAPHGTSTRYQYHKCRCDECRASVREKQRDRRGYPRDLVPAGPFAEVAQEWLGRQEESGNPLALLAEEVRIDKEGLRKIVTGKQPFITFDKAEKLLLSCGQHWQSSAELSCIYEEMDLSWADEKKPTTRLAA